MLAKIANVSSRIVFTNDSSVLCFALHKARFAMGGVQVLLRPSREGLAEIDGLHIWLESGHWMFVCDGRGLGREWLESTSLQRMFKGPGGLLESRPLSARSSASSIQGFTPILSTRR